MDILALIGKLAPDGCWAMVKEDGILICRDESGHAPEDYIAIRRSQSTYHILEGHKDREALRAQAHEPEEGAALAAALGRRIFRDVGSREMASRIRRCVEAGREQEAAASLKRRFGNICCIGLEVPARVSLVKAGNGADVKYAGGYLARDATLPRAYVVLCNYCMILEEAMTFCQEVQAMGIRVDDKNILSLYLYETQWHDQSQDGA